MLYAERERISLSLKQLADDPIANYLNEHEKGSIVSGKVIEVDAKTAVIELADNVQGILKAADIAQEKVDDARTYLSVGDMVEAKMTGTDRKTHTITLSIKAKDGTQQPAKKSATATTTAARGKKKEKSGKKI